MNSLANILPTFPNLFAERISESRLETLVERLVDRTDAKFMRGDVSQGEYDLWCKRLNKWVGAQYDAGRIDG